MKEHFICATEKYSQLNDYVSAPYIRKDFVLPKFKKAKLRICGLGFYELFVNGKKITKGKLAPYISNPEHLIYYDEYDLANILAEGGNALGVILGNGFLNNIGGGVWGFDKAEFRSAPILSLILEIDGVEVLKSDETFKTAPSPIYFDDIRLGEYYDARKEQAGWANYGFDDRVWDFTRKTIAPKGKLVKANVEPITVRKEIKPVSVMAVREGYVFDFGVNTAGICRLKFQGYLGQEIRLWHGETLLEDGSVFFNNLSCHNKDEGNIQKDVFICSGREDVFEPSFTYHGFRYVYMEGISSENIERVSIVLLQLNSSLKETGNFACSNEIVNKLQEITLNSDISNFFYFPTDCPQREKNGWTADAALSCEQLLYNFDCSKSLGVWLDNIRYAQRENGQLPGIVPTVEFGYTWGNGPAWDIVLIELPYQIYRFTGDIKVLKDNTNAIAKYIRFLKTKLNENGLISFGLADWCESGQPHEAEVSTPLEVTDTLVSIDICQKASKIFTILGDDENREFAKKFEEDLKKRFRTVWLDTDLFVQCKTQTAQAKAIDVGIFTESEIPYAVENLVKIINNINNGYFKVGVIGARVLFRVLADNGYANLALELMTKDGFPSYKYWLDNGATSLWEGFNELCANSIFRKDGGRVLSLNHHFWGDISAWFYRYILGVNINPSLENSNIFEISPVYLKNIDKATGSYIRNNQGIKVERYTKGKKVYLKIKTFGDVICKVVPNDSVCILFEDSM